VTRYLKSRKDGWIFEWDPILANNPLCYEVTEQEAYPERFIPPAILEVAVTKRKGRKPIELSTPEPEGPETPPELAAAAARGWPK
jgi:hypothetical protein